MQVLRLFTLSENDARDLVYKHMSRYLSTFRGRFASLPLVGRKLRRRGFRFIKTSGDTKRLDEMIHRIKVFVDKHGRVWALVGKQPRHKYSVLFFEVID